MRPDEEIVVPAALRRRLRELAAAAWPAEACGVLLGRGRAEPGAHGRAAGGGCDEVTGVAPLPNRSAVPRTSYRLHPGDLEPYVRRGDVLGFWHSHPDGTTELSPRDVGEAWPAYWYLVVATPTLTAWRNGRPGRLAHGPAATAAPRSGGGR